MADKTPLLSEESDEERWRPHYESYNYTWQMHRYVYHFVLTQTTLHERWPLMEVHDFCLKACAIYLVVDAPIEPFLLEYLWARWYRPGESPCQFRNFVAKLVASNQPESPKTVPELVEAHRSICAQVSRRQITLDDNDVKTKHNVTDEVDDHEHYKLEPIFRALFLVIEKRPDMDPSTRGKRQRVAWDDEPVLLVRTGDTTVLKLGPINFHSIEGISQEVGGDKNVRRVGLGGAVDFILDLQQREHNAAREDLTKS
ncbi:hypothetical protein MMC24_001443 [Lignoscripta atroalba]|nr:hypothetical protein [Lignoscripta atroalba]